MIDAERVKLERAELAIEAEEKGASIDRAMKDAEDRQNMELLRMAREKKKDN